MFKIGDYVRTNGFVEPNSGVAPKPNQYFRIVKNFGGIITVKSLVDNAYNACVYPVEIELVTEQQAMVVILEG